MAQAQLQSATFEANLGVVMDGKQVEVAIEGAASKQGAAFSVRTTGIPSAGKDMQLVVRGDRAWTNGRQRHWTSMPVPKDAERQERLDGRRRVPGARPLRQGRPRLRAPADRRQARDDHRRRDRHRRRCCEAVTKLGSLSGASGDKAGGFSLDLDDLGIKIGDIKAVLSIDERTHLLDAALITVAVEAQGETLELDLRYRLKSANQPVALPSPSG